MVKLPTFPTFPLTVSEGRRYEGYANYTSEAAASLGIEVSVWACGVVDFSAKPHFSDATTFVYKHHWGQPVTMPVDGIATWADAFLLADTAIRLSGDTHHVFIEQLNYDEHTKTVELECGS